MSQPQLLRIATRKSPLALWQANAVAQQLQHHWPSLSVELLTLTTTGDRFLDKRLLEIGGKGLFVKELEEALLDKRADLAVHSLKDVPAMFPEGLTLRIVGDRGNPFDALISNNRYTLDTLLPGACVGTSSLRRQSQLLAKRPDLQIKTLRGNVNTRLSALDQGNYDAIVLAVAGLQRLELADRIDEVLSEEDMLPACGQGALGIEYREDDAWLKSLIAPLNNFETLQCVGAERHVTALLGGNCHVPVAVYCKPIEQNHVQLQAKVLSPDGKIIIAAQVSGPIESANMLAAQCTQTLLDKGAQDLLQNI